MNVRERIAGPDSLAASVETWLASFGAALANGNEAALHALFQTESYWRDILALTWRIDTVSGSGAVAEALADASAAKPSGFTPDPARTPPRLTTRAGTQSIEAFFTF